MSVAERAKEILNLRELDLPESPRIVGIEVEEFVDHDGDDALWVYALLDPDDKDPMISGESALSVKSQVRKKLFDQKLGAFPYVRFLTADELKELKSIGAG